MSLIDLMPVLLKASIFLLVMSIGLTAAPRDATGMIRSPRKLWRMVVSMNVVVPAFAVAIVYAFDLHPTLRVALVAIAISPVPPFLPIKAMKEGGQRSYTIGLLVAASILSVILIPLTMLLLDRLSPADLAISPLRVAEIVSLSVLLPLAIGIACRHLMPRFAETAARAMLIAAVVLLVAVLVPALAVSWRAMWALVGNGTLLALAALVGVGLLAGHMIGGRVPEERSMLALASGSRHPAVAIALAQANFPDDKSIVPAVLLYLIVCAVVSFPYARWVRARNATLSGGA